MNVIFILTEIWASPSEVCLSNRHMQGEVYHLLRSMQRQIQLPQRNTQKIGASLMQRHANIGVSSMIRRGGNSSTKACRCRGTSVVEYTRMEVSLALEHEKQAQAEI